MGSYTNTSSSRRVWPRIQGPDGHTLELDPGESVDLDPPEGFADPYLQPTVADTTIPSGDEKEPQA